MPFHQHPRTLRCAAALLVALAAAAAHARPTGNTIPAAPRPDAIQAGTQAVQQFIENFGDLSISVAVVQITAQGTVAPTQPPLIRALGAEIESQLRRYTGDQINVLSIEVSPERAQRILRRQNVTDNPSETFKREVVEFASAPYLITVEVGPDPQRQASAGPVTLRFVEVATGRVLNSISSQFYEDRRRFPNINLAAWVQHSVTYWMNEMMGYDPQLNAVSGGLPAALRPPFLLRLQFTGTIDRRDRVKLKDAVGSAVGVEGRRINLRSTRENGLDVATADLRVNDPPHFMLDDLVIGVEDAMAEAGLTAQPLRETGGDVIFAVSSVPAWWALTGGDPSSTINEAWRAALEANGQPSVAVIKYADPNLIRQLADQPEGLALSGAGTILVASIERQLRGLGVDVVAVEPAQVDFSRHPWGSVKDVEQALPENLRRRAEWAFVLEIVPGLRPDAPPRTLARLVDLQADRVLGSSVFPGDAAAVPPGERVPDEATHAARYLTGTTAAQVVAGDNGIQIMDLVVLRSPSFDFVNRVGNIARGRSEVVRTKLPTWQADQPYSIEVHYRGPAADFVERLRADLSTLPLGVGAFEEGKMTLVHGAAGDTP
ncbi:MAG: hypothetical protein AAF800_00865 [Planctomycetota bacterium]